jgi:centrosomal protein CEP135
MNSSSVSEQKYIQLRKRLDQLGYRQTLGIESLALIEKLFNDLVHTTESLKKSKQEVTKQADQMNDSLKNVSILDTNDNTNLKANLVPATVQAYKNDNGKLIKENNELHLKLVKIQDDFDGQIKGKIFHLNID